MIITAMISSTVMIMVTTMAMPVTAVWPGYVKLV